MRGISVTFISRNTAKDKKNVSIYLNIRVHPFPAKRVSSGITVPTKNFTKGTVIGTSKALTDTKKRLDLLKEKIEEAYYIFIKENKIPNPELLLQFVENSGQEAMTILKLAHLIVNQKKADLIAKNCTPALVEKFEILKTQLEDFVAIELRKNDLFLEETNFNFVNQFRMYLQTKCKNKNVTVNKKMSNLGQLFKYAVKNGWLQRDPTTDLNSLEEPKTNHEFLSEDQVRQLMKFDLPKPEYQVVKDSFLFMCFTGMAFSDMANFSLDNIQELQGNQFIVYSRKKTKQEICLPINPVVAELISSNASKKIKDPRTKDFRSKKESEPVFTVQAMQVYNRRLKTFFEYNDMILKFEISSHCARKTFGNMVNSHMGITTASQFLGHSSVSVTETNYVDNNHKSLAVARGLKLNEIVMENFKHSTKE